MEIIKHPQDPATYKMHRLKNGLTVLTVNNPMSTRSVAMVQVNVGYADDPEEFDGLAHFLEHMLFMGSVKYPDPNKLIQTLEKYNGIRNADTDIKLTTYYVECYPDGYDEVIDVFLQFFIAPLMSEDGVSKEMNAVNAEYLKNINNNSWLIQRLFDVMSNEPWNKFGSGNIDTLDKPGVHAALLKLYQRYSANQMYVVLYHDSNNFTLALELLNQIPNHNVTLPIYPLLSYKPGLVITSPEGVTDYIVVSWVLPKCDYLRKEYIYLQYMLNYPYNDGLKSVLRRHSLITDMNTMLQSYNNVWTLTIYFSIDSRNNKCDPTCQLKQVLSTLYEFIEVVRGDPEPSYMELRQIYKYRQLKFEFPGNSLAECRNYISNISDGSPDSHVVMRMELYEKYSEKEMQKMFSYLIHDNSVVVHSSVSYNKFTLRDELYRLDYSIMPHLELSLQKLGVKLPPLNEYLIKPKKMLLEFINTTPTKQVINNQVWHQEFNDGGVITVMFYFFFNTSQTPKNIRLEYIYNEMMQRLTEQDRNELFHASGEALVSVAQNVIQLKISGTLPQLEIFLQRFSNILNNFDPADFDQINQITVDEFNNFDYEQPFDQLITYIEVAQSINHLPKELVKIQTTRDELITYHNSFKHACQMKVQVLGNIQLDSIRAICSKLSYYNSATAVMPSKIRIITDKMVYPATNINNINSAYGAYYHCGEFKTVTLQYFYILIIDRILNEQFYDYLRTKKQLGYLLSVTLDEIIYSDSFATGLTFRVQSPITSSSEIRKHVNTFLKQCHERIPKVELQQIIKAIILDYSGDTKTTILIRFDAAILHSDYRIDRTLSKLREDINLKELSNIYYDLLLNPDTIQRTEVLI